MLEVSALNGLTLIQALIEGLSLGGIYCLISVGLNLVFGVMNIVNFAHGEFLMVAMYIAYWLNYILGVDPYFSIFIVAPLMFVFGMLCQRILIEPILDREQNDQVIVTLGLSLILQNLILFLFSADYRTILTPYTYLTFNIGGIHVPFVKILCVLFSILSLSALYIFLYKTKTGKAVMAVAQNRIGASIVGVNVARVDMIAFGLALALVGIGGAVILPYFWVFPSVGQLFIVRVLLIIVAGGLGKLKGAIICSLIMGITESITVLFVAPIVKDFILFVVFTTIFLLKPGGLFD
ncbi:MAG: branched-chain amino acid ABC transporter permease [Candidatus Bathyarchaeia archaeon]